MSRLAIASSIDGNSSHTRRKGEPLMETIGQRLRRLRTDRGLSQREIASPGVSYAYISRIEAGSRNPSVKALRMLAAKLGVPEEYLEYGEQPVDNEPPPGSAQWRGRWGDEHRRSARARRRSAHLHAGRRDASDG